MKKNKRNIQTRVRERIANAVDISKDIILDTVLIRGTGNKEIIIENYKGILEYSDTVIRIKARPRCIKLCGKGLELCNISDEILCITGDIDKILFTEGQEGSEG